MASKVVHLSDADTRKPAVGDVETALTRVLASGQFAATTRLSKFLMFIVEETLAGRGDRLKGYTIGVEVFERGEDFNAEADTIVRVQAGQLRRRLDLYYAGEGAADPLRIALPKGGYTPSFSFSKTAKLGADAAASVAAPLPKGPAIAVMPFESISHDADTDLIAAGLSEEIRNDLTRFRDILVTARSGVASLAGRAADIDEIGEVLGVDYVLTGAVRKAGGRIRIGVQMIDAASQAIVYAKQYDRDLTPDTVLDIEDEIADRVVAALAAPYGVMAAIGAQDSRRKSAVSLDAMEAVHRYYAFEASPSPEEHEALRLRFEQLVEAHPDFTNGWAALSALYLDEARLKLNTITDPPALTRTISAAEQAIALDPQSSMPRHFLFCALFHTGDHAGFEREARQAIALNPNHLDMIADYAFCSAIIGELDRGRPFARKALALSVQPPGWYHSFAWLEHFEKGEYTEAYAFARHQVDDQIAMIQARFALSAALAGDMDTAGHFAERALALDPDYAENWEEDLALWQVRPAIVDRWGEGLQLAGILG